jgi:CRISPR-associated helicase Cas3/CRISPR-associated endonuclease Cas3-HD
VAYLAHSANAAGRPQTLGEHLRRTAEIAALFASSFGASDEARLAGLLHDLGKYGDLFQLRLRGEVHGVDHWSPGAWVGISMHRNIAAALAVQGHHIGLQSMDSLRDLKPEKLAVAHPLGLTLSEADPGVLSARLAADGLSVPTTKAAIYGPCRRNTASAMLDLRMLYSTLVDADFLDTEAHFDPDAAARRSAHAEGARLNPAAALEVLLDHLRTSSSASGPVKLIRSDLLQACLAAADSPPGLWTLSAPTGAGKTLAMLAFALRHAAAQGLRRVVVVIPYLSIIEQTARIYRSILGEASVLEHHSLTGTGYERIPTGQDDLDGDSEDYRLHQAAAENWDAPVVVTTSVQMLESLFSNRPSACRKLHRLARSVVLFDEVQTLPDHLAVPTLATLARLAERYQTTVVFATATQPAFAHLDQHVRQIGDSGWQPKEMVSPDLRLFDRVKRRTHVRWPDLDRTTSWDGIAVELSTLPQALCIVNVKAHASDLFKLVSAQVQDGCFHLSTAMCPVHRQDVLDAVRTRLADGQPCRLISTQCVEAGVDLDFPTVYRALGPLEAVAQAAGRCNRNGALSAKGEVRVFLPEDDKLPSGAYRQAADVTRMLLKEYGPAGLDLGSPALFDEYYRRLYSLTQPEAKRPELLKAIQGQDFAEVAKRYRMIEHDAINVLVPYRADAFEALAAEARERGLTAAWIRNARAHTVGVYRPKNTDPIWTRLEPVPVGRRRRADDWFILTDCDSYDSQLGLLPPDAPSVWMV